ncbi:hypothetical protein PAAG_02779 [Paracoccidioides lutzii Pb01]|uniref:Uncharacterized protein n=1 Tax=Paracoccidioides lutzii (strain ATCC MYA-826 / Pb01) TaxID=502779 RepID=C1GW84_PARBA|nr:hypothetical protein PAAG_02779 [Paracoccidioides lutzii Pb01]EEH40803.2 hypothetical protein PAAG_02779 [Paracoccidioides lutzii Pb01]
MASFDVWSPIISFLAMIQYINALVGARGEMRSVDGIINCTYDVFLTVKEDFEKLQEYLPSSRKRYFERQINRTERELKKARDILDIEEDQNMGKRRINDIYWVLKRKADLQICLTALHQCHSTLLEIRLELAILENKLPWVTDRFTLEPRTLSYPRLGSSGDMNNVQGRLKWAQGDYSNGSILTLPTSMRQRKLLTSPPLTSRSGSSTISPQYSAVEEMSLWLLQKRRDDVFI